MAQEKLEIICQNWHDGDQFAGTSLHISIREWLKYKNETINKTKNNPYPFEPIGEPYFVRVNTTVENRLRKRGSIMYEYNSINEQKRKVILEELK